MVEIPLPSLSHHIFVSFHAFSSEYIIIYFVFNYLRFEFCWHWWSCWPSLFKLSFQKKSLVIFSHYNIVACNSNRSNYQRGKGGPIIRGGAGLINRFNPVAFVCLSQDRVWISNIIWCGVILYQWAEVRGDCCFVAIGRIVDHCCLNFLCHMNAFFSFLVFMVYIPECKQDLRNYEIIHADTRYCKL